MLFFLLQETIYWQVNKMLLVIEFEILPSITTMRITSPHLIQFPVLPVIVIQGLESQEAEEGGSVILLCVLSKPGLLVEWKKETQVLTCGEKYRMKNTGLNYYLQIFDLKPGDSGSYSSCAEDTASLASLVVNGRMETLSSSYAVLLQPSPSFLYLLHCTCSSPFLIFY